MMMLVCFKLENENAAFEAELKSLGNWSNRMPGAWLLESPLSPRKVRDMLAEKAGPNDRIFVARISQSWAGRNMGAGFPEWMNRRDFGPTATTGTPSK